MLGRTNTGGGSSGDTLTVTAPAGSTVSVSKDGKTKTKVVGSDDTAFFKGLSSGVWTVEATDGTETVSKTVSITTDYVTTLTFFSATIKVTYPAKSTCTCKNGSTTLTDTNTGTSAKTVTFTVLKSGTWTITANETAGLKDSVSTTVSVTTSGESKTAKLTYTTYLYKSGTTYSSLTGGWTASGYEHGGSALKAATADSTKLTFTGVDGSYVGRGTANKISMSYRTTLTIKGNLSSINTSNNRGFIIAVASAKDGISSPSARLYVNATGSFTKTIDVSSITSAYVCVYIYGHAEIKGTVTEVYLT